MKAIARNILIVAVLLAVVSEHPAAATEASAGWTRQFGTRVADEALGVALDPLGNAYVVGWTFGTLPAQHSAGTVDAFIRKYDPTGNEVWTRQFGSGGGEGAWGVALDPAGNAYVVGTTRAALPGQSPAGGFDAFVRRYDPAGNEVWTRQFGSEGDEGGRSVALDAHGNVLVVGSTDRTLPGETSAGGYDVYVRQYDGAGNELWTQQFGSAADDYGVAVAVDPRGQALVVGSADRALPGQSSAGGTDAFLRSFDATGTERWTKQFGTKTIDDAWGVAIDTAGHAYVVGSTEQNLPGQHSAGGSDVFVRQYDTDGDEVSTRQFGTQERDLAYAVAVDDTGPRIVGSTRGALSGQPSAGDRDAYIST